MAQATKMVIAEAKMFGFVPVRPTSWLFEHSAKVLKAFQNGGEDDASKGDDDCESGVLH